MKSPIRWPERVLWGAAIAVPTILWLSGILPGARVLITAIGALLVLRLRAAQPAVEPGARVVADRPARRFGPWLILLAQLAGAFSIILLVALFYGWKGDPTDIELAVICVAVLLACGFTVWHLRDDAMWDKWRM